MNPANAINIWFSKRAQRWLARKIPVVSSTSLHRKNIFILPTGHGLLFVTATTLVFVTAINYVLSLAFGLAFLMISLFLITILHTFRNLQHMTVKGLNANAVFAGEDAAFPVLLRRGNGRVHETLELRFPGGIFSYAELLDSEQERVNVYLPAPQRGVLRAPRLIVQTRFPLGLWRAWSRLDLGLSCLVYPAPVAAPLRRPSLAVSSGTAESTRPGAEDFHGLRNYLPGDSLKHVAWKNLARGQGLKVKQFVDMVDDQLILDWSMFPGLNAEERLSRLCFWVLKLARSETEYGLRIPGVDIPAGSGEVHRKRLLTELALWGGRASGGIKTSAKDHTGAASSWT